ncbi:MAG: nucleotidyltransferase domain-containing protein [bacterium]|nr:nucleotidyltransferase domain-containing protein [bacterium]
MEIPGTIIHKQILNTLLELFKKDKNVRAFIIFGSLVRGNWDKYSDLDLDVVVKEIKVDIVRQEVEEMIKVLNNQIKILHYFEEFTNEFVFIFDSLDRMSIRFHTLEDTHPAITESMKILYGDITVEEIKNSQNIQLKKETNLQMLNNKFLEHVIYVQLSIKRNKLINASFFLNKMRQIIIEMYVKTRGKREFDFEEIVDNKIKQKIASIYYLLNNQSMEIAYKKLIDLYENSIKEISSGKIILKNNEKLILEKVFQY